MRQNKSNDTVRQLLAHAILGKLWMTFLVWNKETRRDDHGYESCTTAGLRIA